MNTKKILIFEDNDLDIDIYKIIFEKLNQESENTFSIHYVKDNPSFLEIINEIEFDLILSDLRIGMKTSLESIKHITSQAKFRGLPIVVLSSSNYDQDITQSIEAGASHFATKPQSFTKFREYIEKIIKTYF